MGGVTKHDVLGDSEPFNEPEVLVHHADAVGEPISGTAQAHRLTTTEELPFVGLVEPAQHCRERALAGAVFSEQRVHLAFEELEVDLLIGEHPREPFADPAGSDGGHPGRARARPGSFVGGPVHYPLALPTTPSTK